MLSYRHGYHAGNHADILKHMTLCVLMRIMRRKKKPMTIIDTHAGAGLYTLGSAFAQKNREFETGLSRVINDAELQRLVPEFYDMLSRANQKDPFKKPAGSAGTGGDKAREGGAESAKSDDTRTVEQEESKTFEQRMFSPKTLARNLERNTKSFVYPGSPFFECCLSSRSDSVFLSDLHTAEFESLRDVFKRQHKMHIELADGLGRLKALLPPVKRCSLILMDPSYEMKSDYHEVIKAVKEGQRRLASGVFVIWYPVLSRMSDHSKHLVQNLRRTGLPLLQAELRVSAQQEDFGMCGSGMLIVNYPYGTETELEPVIGRLYETLCDQETGGAVLNVLNERA